MPNFAHILSFMFQATKCCILGNEPFVYKTLAPGDHELMMKIDSCTSEGSVSSVYSSPLSRFKDECDLSCGGAGTTPIVASGAARFCCMSEGERENFTMAGVALRM